MSFTKFVSLRRVSGVAIAATLALTAFSADVRAASFDTLYSFPASGKRGNGPTGIMVRDAKGALYGVTTFGGDDGSCLGGCGVIYQLKPTSSGPWTQKVLHIFSQQANGAQPNDGLIAGPDGTLYGTTSFGGSLNGGTVFALTPPAPGHSQWTFETLHEFDGSSTNDHTPYGKLMLGNDGALYGMDGASGAGTGTIFRLKRTNSGWAYRALHHFTERLNPRAGLVQDTNGRLYGVGINGGPDDHGVLFRLSPPAQSGGDWTYKVLHNFRAGPADASSPPGTLVLRDDALYGQAASNVFGEGSVVFRLTLPSSFEIIYRMDLATQGTGYGTGLAIDDRGALYGVTDEDGPGGNGALFKLVPPKASGGDWRFRLLHAFSGTPDGSFSDCQPLLDADGNIYVNAVEGGAGGAGGVFVYRP